MIGAKSGRLNRHLATHGVKKLCFMGLSRLIEAIFAYDHPAGAFARPTTRLLTRLLNRHGNSIMNRTVVRLAAPMLIVLGFSLDAAVPAAAQETTISHGSSLVGELKYGPEFTHFEYTNPDAPKGGEVKFWAFGSFDTMNPFTLKGRTAAGVGLTFETLMTSAADEPSSHYGLIAETMEFPDDSSWVIFNLRPEARWHDGTPITADDVIFSFETITKQGHPFYRSYYASVATAEKLGEHRVRFNFSETGNRELPHIMGQLNIISKAYYTANTFDETTLEAPLGSGAYRVASVDPGRSVTLVRVVDYWGADLPVNKGRNNYDTIRWDYFLDQTVALEAFKAHDYDYRSENSSSQWATQYEFPAVKKNRVITEEIKHRLPQGMQSFAFNTRRSKFKDRNVRRALALAFDFEWSNKNLFYGQYTRTNSFFANSELGAAGLPSAAELVYLEPVRGQVPEEVFTTEFKMPVNDGSGNIRQSLRVASGLLREAGWSIKDGKLVEDATGQAMEIEFLLSSPQFERIVSPYIRNLERLGVEARVRTVDTAQYKKRTDDFDFDVIVGSFRQSLSPGNEQRNFWGSYNVEISGSRNLIGVNDPVVDKLIDQIIAAPDRESLIAVSRALDRVLLWNHYVVPQWFIDYFRIAYWDRFGRPEFIPRYGLDTFAWWIDPEKDAALEAGKSGGQN